jgi:hypothetical protein
MFIALIPPGAFASVWAIGAVGVMGDEGSTIRCFYIAAADTIVSGGSESLVHVWSVPNSELIDAISVDCLTILRIDVCSALNLVVIVDW